MAGDPEALLGEAQAALEAGDWSAARASFTAALEHVEPPEALFGLGIALWWLAETEPSLGYWKRAYGGFRWRGDRDQAVLAAFYLCLAYRMSLGNDAAARGWLGRAESLAGELEGGPMAGWVLLARAYLDTDSGQPQAGEGSARQALDIARRAADADLELSSGPSRGASSSPPAVARDRARCGAPGRTACPSCG